MRITIDPFDPKSIDKAVLLLKAYKDDFLAKETEFIRRLAEIGVSVASTGFSMAEYDGVNDVVVRFEQNGNQATVVAYGETVGFIEFGTGVRYEEYDSSTTEYTPPPHGSYGQGKGANPQGWYFNQSEGAAGRHTYGNPPAEAMLTARDVMVERIIDVAREVWK